MSETRDQTDTSIDPFLREIARTPELSADLALRRPLFVGRQIRQYSITRLIGRGGMGQVFAAHDRLLGREVAIKLLPPSFTVELRRRFLQEARSLAQIQHPAVATFYEAGEDDGLAFLAMEYVAGDTLRACLERGPMEQGKCLAIVLGLLEGLAHIHHANLVHRDIKPENVIVTRHGAAKLLDLGIATAMHASIDNQDHGPVDDRLTELGAVVGSLEYMSPEQLAGEPLDGRSDLFSLGVVLFECLTGRHPFRGVDREDTQRRIREGEVASIPLGLLGDGLRTVFARLLAVDRTARYAAVAPLLRELQALAVGAVPGPRLPDSILVVPFADGGGDDWSGAALAEAVRRQLQRCTRVVVVGREQTAGLRAVHGDDPTAIGLAGACRWVVSGSLSREGRRWLVGADLLRVATDSIATTCEAVGDDLGVAARTVVTHVLEAIGLAGDPIHGELSPDDLVSRAMELAWRRTSRRDFREAMELLENVLQIDSDHVEALAQFGQIAGLLHSSTGDPALCASAQARLERAVELDPNNPLANQWLGYNLSARGRLIEAEQHFARALAAEPNNWQHHYFHAGSLLALPLDAVAATAARWGQSDHDPIAWRRTVAVGELRKAATLAPRNAFAYWGLGAVQYELGCYEEAAVAFERAVELEKTSPLATGGIAAFLAEARRRQGRGEQARRAALAALETTETNDHMYRDLFRSVALCALGRTLLDLDDLEGARASFEQSRLLLEARPAVRSGGNVLVQSLAGLGACGDSRLLDRAKRLFEHRETHSFDWVHMCTDDFALAQIARACLAVSDPEASTYLERARRAGAVETFGREVA